MSISFGLSGQILYSNTFDNGLNGMTILDMDKNTPHPNVSEFQGTWTALGDSRFDEYPDNAAISASYYSPIGTSDDWLITPAINIPAGTVMTWDAVSLDNQFRDSYEILVSTTGTNPADFSEVIFKVDREENTLTTRTVSLNDFVGQTIYIAFRNTSNDKFLLVIDNIFVRLPFDRDVFVKSLDVDLSNVRALDKKTTLFGMKSITANLLNFGKDRITNMTVAYTLNGQRFEETISANVLTGETMTFTSEEIQVPIGKDQQLQFEVVSVNSQNDEDPSNNSNQVIFDVQPKIPVYTFKDSKGRDVNLHNLLRAGKTVVLNFFRSDCSDCADSFEKLNQYYLATGAGNQNLEIIGITVNSDDSNSILNDLGWSATFPLIQYFPYNDLMWVHYTESLGLGEDAEAPFFVQICPNQDNPAFSNISVADGYENPNVFNEKFRPEHTACQAGVSSLSEIESIENISVYPNPSLGDVTIDMNVLENSEVLVSVTDLKGKLIKNLGLERLNRGNNKVNYNLNDLESGVYILNLRQENRITNLKLTILK